MPTINQALEDQNILVDTSGGSKTIQLVSVAAMPTRPLVIKKKTSDANTVTIQPAASELIDGASSIVLSSAQAYVVLKSAGGAWIIVSQNGSVSSTGGGGPLVLTFTGSAWSSGVAFTGGLVAAGGAGGYTYSISFGSLPAWATLNTSTGRITGTPTVGVTTFTGKVTDSAAATATLACTITVTATNPGNGPPGAEITNATISSVHPTYDIGADGNEYWQAVTVAAPPTDDNFGYAQAILCPVALLATGGISSTTGGYAGGNITLNVTPWGAASTVTVSGSTVTVTSGPAFNTALKTNYVNIQGELCQVFSYASPTVATIYINGTTTQPTAQGAGKTFIPMECRYGIMQNGDTVMIDSELFTIGASNFPGTFGATPTGGFLGATCLSQWTLVRSPGMHPSHTSGTLIIDVHGVGVNPYAGSLFPGAIAAISQPWLVGAPTAYLTYLVSVSTTGQMNTWPVPGTTPQSGPYAAEIQTTGSVLTTRLDSTQLGPGLVGGAGNVLTAAQIGQNLLNNQSFELLPLGSGWLFNSPGMSAITSATFPPHSGTYCLGINASSATYNGYAIQANPALLNGFNYLRCVPGQVYQFSAFVAATGGTNGTVTLKVNFYDASYGGSFTTVTSVAATSSTSYGLLTVQVPVPAGAFFLAPYINFAAASVSPAGVWAVDDLVFEKLPATNGAIDLDLAGSLIVNAGGALSISGGNLVITSGGITIGYLPSGSSFTAAVSSLPGLPSGSYPPGCWVFDITNGRQYYNNANVWVDKGDPGDMVSGTIAAGVVYAGAIACSQLVAGTITAAISMTAPTLTITGSGFTVNIDATNGVKITDGSSNYLQINSGGFTLSGPSGGVGAITASPQNVSANWTHTSSGAGTTTANFSVGATIHGTGTTSVINAFIDIGSSAAGASFSFDCYAGLAVQWGGVSGTGITTTFQDFAGHTHQVVAGIIVS